MRVVFWKLFFLLFQLNYCTAVIYHLNASEYKKLPPVFHLDPFNECKEAPDGVYCAVEFVPFSESSHSLLDTMREYSQQTITHYNHTLMRYGICINFCKQFEQNNTISEQKRVLEACVNENYWEKYRLNTTLTYYSCSEIQKETEYKTIDVVMLVVVAVILLLNIIGSCCDVFISTKEKGFVVRALLVFAIRRNWKKLIIPAGTGSEPRLKSLKAIHGIKAITMIMVIFVHGMGPAFFYIDNTHFLEELYNYLVIQMSLNGVTCLQNFFILTGFLLAYNVLLHSEKHSITWVMLPKGIFMRWWRLIPPYALLLLFTVSWMRFMSTGAAWDKLVMEEVEDCNQYWWYHILFINNYSNQKCLGQTWYLAADMQLFCLGLVVVTVFRSATAKKVVFSILLIIGLITSPLHTYYQDLDGMVLAAPETVTHFFLTSYSFLYLHASSHTSLFNFVLGIALAHLIHHLQQINFDIQKYKKYKILFWSILPAQGLIWMTGRIYYWEGPRTSMAVRLAFAGLVKPQYGICFATLLLGFAFKYENVYRVVMEARMWVIPSRLSYTAYLLHVTVMRIFLGSNKVIAHVTLLSVCQQSVFLVVVSIIMALPVWLLVEQPFTQLAKLFTTESNEKQDQNGDSQPDKKIKADETALDKPDIHLRKI